MITLSCQTTQSTTKITDDNSYINKTLNDLHKQEHDFDENKLKYCEKIVSYEVSLCTKPDIKHTQTQQIQKHCTLYQLR